ncbi:MAG: NAD(P)/FAD-dependent oxidoreductase [Nitriliruptoraceae bacterium]
MNIRRDGHVPAHPGPAGDQGVPGRAGRVDASARIDAVVVGAGPNGLAAALTLAREGFRVVVLEAADEPGGGTRSVKDPDVDGLIHDHCSAVHAFGAASPFLRSLPLERHGLKWVHPPVAVAHPLDDGTAGTLYRDLDTTAKGLGDDGAAWKSLFGGAVRNFDKLAHDLLGPVLRIPRHPFAIAPTALRSLMPATAIARKFQGVEARALFGGVAAHVISPLNRPLSASVGMMLIAAGHAWGWPFAAGGSQSIWRAMASYLEELGGEIRTGVTVRSMADIPRARVVLFDVGPGPLVEILGDQLPSRRSTQLKRWRYGTAAFKVDYVIDGEVPWNADRARLAGTVHLGGTFEEIMESEHAVHQGQQVDRPFVLVTQPHVADPSRKVDGKTPLWTYAHVPHGTTRDATATIDAQIERFARGFGQRVVARRVTTPADFEAWNPNFVGGDIAGGATDGLQLIARPRLAVNPYTTGIPGMFQCSASTPPGAGVHGLSGHHAARHAVRLLTR